MKITIKLTKKEKELLMLFKTRGSLSAYNDMDGWWDTPEWKSLRDSELIFHCNHGHDGAYIRYALTDLGEKAYSQNVKS